jgi:hypothetical protein
VPNEPEPDESPPGGLKINRRCVDPALDAGEQLEDPSAPLRRMPALILPPV